jgi:hypothetical protein
MKILKKYILQQICFSDIICSQAGGKLNHPKVIFVAVFGIMTAFCTNAAAPSKCPKTNLTRCLDSGCAINIGMNPAARCQYCGTSAAGDIPTQKGLSNVTVGQSAKYDLTEKELRVAPSDPGKRYIWVTTECLKKLPKCTTDDVSDIYDKLIEQSCKAAGVSMQMETAISNLDQKPTKNKCNTTFTTCMDKKCGTAFATCEDDSDFTRFIGECATESTGCDEYIAEFRESLTTSRKSAYANRENLVQTLVTNYQTTRENKLKNARANCTNGSASKTCVDTVCANNMTGKCETSTERSIATQLCKFYETACTVLK